MNGTTNHSFTFSTNTTKLTEKSLIFGTPSVLVKVSLGTTISVIMSAIGLVANSLILLVFVKEQSLRTPFNVYLINLVFANTLSMLVVYPFNILVAFYPIWFLGDSACAFYIYGRYVLQAGIFNTHQLIAINRMWSVIHPYSYRAAHITTRRAVQLCLAMWLYVHLFILPGCIPEVIHNLLPANGRRCLLVQALQSKFDIALQFVMFDVPLVTMIAAFPVIFITRKVRDRWKNVRKSHAVHPALSTEQSRDKGSMTQPPQMSVRPDTSHSEELPPQQPVLEVKRFNTGFVVLCLLTASMAICWAPAMILYTMGAFRRYNAPMTYDAVLILFSFQSTLDPLLFILALKNLRRAMRRLFRSC